MYFRSSWESNWARYLEWLRVHGEIQSWEFEPETFYFEGIKRGTRFYTPDFRVVEKNGTVVYHEIKGFMDDVSATKLKRMKKYHPQIKVIVVGKDEYNGIKSTMKYIIKGWEN